MYVEKGIEVDEAMVATVDEAVVVGIFVLIIALVTRSGNLKHRAKERHHKEGKLTIYVTSVEWKGIGHVIVISHNILLIYISHLKDQMEKWWKPISPTT